MRTGGELTWQLAINLKTLLFVPAQINTPRHWICQDLRNLKILCGLIRPMMTRRAFRGVNSRFHASCLLLLFRCRGTFFQVAKLPEPQESLQPLKKRPPCFGRRAPLLFICQQLAWQTLRLWPAFSAILQKQCRKQTTDVTTQSRTAQRQTRCFTPRS